jgi:hypothetical protein
MATKRRICGFLRRKDFGRKGGPAFLATAFQAGGFSSWVRCLGLDFFSKAWRPLLDPSESSEPKAVQAECRLASAEEFRLSWLQDIRVATF